MTVAPEQQVADARACAHRHAQPRVERHEDEHETHADEDQYHVQNGLKHVKKRQRARAEIDRS